MHCDRDWGPAVNVKVIQLPKNESVDNIRFFITLNLVHDLK